MCRNGKGETPVHCAAYNSDDNGSLMEYLMEVCEKNGTLDTHEILSLHEKEARVRYMYMYNVYTFVKLCTCICICTCTCIYRIYTCRSNYYL